MGYLGIVTIQRKLGVIEAKKEEIFHISKEAFFKPLNLPKLEQAVQTEEDMRRLLDNRYNLSWELSEQYYESHLGKCFYFWNGDGIEKPYLYITLMRPSHKYVKDFIQSSLGIDIDAEIDKMHFVSPEQSELYIEVFADHSILFIKQSVVEEKYQGDKMAKAMADYEMFKGIRITEQRCEQISDLGNKEVQQALAVIAKYLKQYKAGVMHFQSDHFYNPQHQGTLLVTFGNACTHTRMSRKTATQLFCLFDTENDGCTCELSSREEIAMFDYVAPQFCSYLWKWKQLEDFKGISFEITAGY